MGSGHRMKNGRDGGRRHVVLRSQVATGRGPLTLEPSVWFAVWIQKALASSSSTVPTGDDHAETGEQSTETRGKDCVTPGLWEHEG